MTIIPLCMRKCRQSVQSVNAPSLNRTPTSTRCLSGISVFWVTGLRFGLGFGFGYGLGLLPAWFTLSLSLCVCLYPTLTPFLSLLLFLADCIFWLLSLYGILGPALCAMCRHCHQFLHHAYIHNTCNNNTHIRQHTHINMCICMGVCVCVITSRLF